MTTAVEVRKPPLAPPAPPTCAKGNMRSLELRGHVGFDSLPDQLVQKATHAGFTFNLLCVGETGIGKTTLVESLFNMTIDIPPCSHELTTVELRSRVYDIEESNTRLKLTIVETAGFGDQLDKDQSTKVIVDYLNRQFELYLQEELKIQRRLYSYHDTRIHACIYFISPTGHGLKALDVACMRELCNKVNIIPIIAKADTVSKDELKRFKQKILSELRAAGIETYKLPGDDDSVAQLNQALNAQMPYAVVGSTDFVTKSGKKVRARQYPWGVVEVENEDHCDFVKLREALLRINVEDLRERTHETLYEAYRKQRLLQMDIKDGDLGQNLQQTYQQRIAEQNASCQAKEQEMRARFLDRVKAKEQELKEQELELSNRSKTQKETFDQEMAKLNEQSKKLDQEMADFDRQKAQYTSTLARKQKK